MGSETSYYICALKLNYLYIYMTTIQIETGHTYLLDGKTPVRVLKTINRSKTIFSIELPNRSVEMVGIERLQPQQADESSLETIDPDLEPGMHSMPDINNTNESAFEDN